MKILVVMPFYNEGNLSKKFSEEIIKVLNDDAQQSFDYLLIDDFSIDDTFDNLLKVEKNYDCVTVFKNKNNYGHGKTVVRGYQYGKENGYDIVVQIDGDNAAEPKSIRELINYAIKNELDLCLAKRLNRPDNFIRKIITKVLFLNLLIRYRVKSVDSNVGIRYINMSILNVLDLPKLENLLIPNAFLSTFAYYKKFSVTSFPVKMRDNVRNDRLGEQWGSGRSLSSIKKLLEGAYKCFVEVNKDFKKLI
jgi:cellulose synthase/poly-beta-1,6-N-acetylglucosamine synthase-like glycosyltransferase